MFWFPPQQPYARKSETSTHWADLQGSAKILLGVFRTVQAKYTQNTLLSYWCGSVSLKSQFYQISTCISALFTYIRYVSGLHDAAASCKPDI